jgi:glutamine amidotransferase-like uncharacterized protein
MRKLVLMPIVLLLIMAVVAVSFWNYTRSPTAADVAIYAGRGVWEDSVVACQEMFRWMNHTVELVNAEYINEVGLEGFRVLVVPGGDMYAYAEDISSEGKENIRNFVRNGGGYIGICGGAYFAAKRVVWRGSQLAMTPLGLFNGTATGPIDEIMPYPNYTMCKINIVNHVHPITEPENDSITILYYWGPALTSDGETNVTVLGQYEKGSQPAIVSLEYSQGRVFLIGTHPEIEEDSNRDKVVFGDEFSDEGSDWGLMQRAVAWTIHE